MKQTLDVRKNTFNIFTHEDVTGNLIDCQVYRLRDIKHIDYNYHSGVIIITLISDQKLFFYQSDTSQVLQDVLSALCGD